MGRILVTGSRSWDDIKIIRDALAKEFLLDPDAVLVSGAQRSRRIGPNGQPQYFGADYLCEKVWEAFGGRVERHPAPWRRYGRRAGMVRNEYMVEMGADKCLAFIRNGSPGAIFTANLAEHKGIPTERHIINDKKPKKSLPTRRKRRAKKV